MISSIGFQKKIDAVPNKPFAADFKYEPYRIMLSDDAFKTQTSKVIDPSSCPPNILNSLAMIFSV